MYTYEVFPMDWAGVIMWEVWGYEVGEAGRFIGRSMTETEAKCAGILWVQEREDLDARPNDLEEQDAEDAAISRLYEERIVPTGRGIVAMAQIRDANGGAY